MRLLPIGPEWGKDGLTLTYEYSMILQRKARKAITRIKDMLKNHPEIHQETIFVNLDKFGDSGLKSSSISSQNYYLGSF